MMILSVKLFGVFPLFTVELPGHDLVGDEQSDDPHIEGGSAHNFERDVNPVSPEDRYAWEWEDRRKGFGFR